MLVKISYDDLLSILKFQTRDDVKNIFRNMKRNIGKCAICDETNNLQTVHKQGHDRLKIIKEILSNLLKQENDVFSREEFLLSFRKYHESNKIVCFLCTKHHRQYDNKTLSKNIPDDKWLSLQESPNKRTDKTGKKSAYPVYPRAKNNSGVGKLAYECINKEWDFQKTKDFILKKVPDSHFSKKCYSWYKYHLHKQSSIKKGT